MGFLYSKYIITCKNVITHSDATLTFERAFETYSVKKFPTKIGFYLVVGLEYSLTDRDDLTISFELTDPYDELMAKSTLLELEPLTDDNSAFVVNVTDLKNIPVKSSGLYTIYIKHNEKVLCKQDILVSKGGKNS